MDRQKRKEEYDEAKASLRKCEREIIEILEAEDGLELDICAEVKPFDETYYELYRMRIINLQEYLAGPSNNPLTIRPEEIEIGDIPDSTIPPLGDHQVTQALAIVNQVMDDLLGKDFLRKVMIKLVGPTLINAFFEKVINENILDDRQVDTEQ